MSEHFGPKPSLRRADMQSGTWDRLEADLEARLQVLREQNDSSCDAEATAKRRGRIAEIKELLAFGRETRAQPSELDR